MKSSRYSEAALKTTLQLCSVAVVVCVMAVVFVSTRRTAAQRRNEVAAQVVQEARARLEKANENRLLIDKYRDRHDQLVREGLMIRFDRAVAGDWFEAAIRGQRGALVGSYVIGKDSLFTGPETSELTAFRVVSHRLDFSATAADEDEIAELMNSIEKRVPGTTAQEACSIVRNGQSRVGVEVLDLHCALVWYEFAPSNTELAANESGT